VKFSFSSEQEEFRSNLRRLLADRSPTKEVRRLMETDQGYERDGWRAINTALGLTAIRIPEAYGGSRRWASLVSPARSGCSGLRVSGEDPPPRPAARKSSASGFAWTPFAAAAAGVRAAGAALTGATAAEPRSRVRY